MDTDPEIILANLYYNDSPIIKLAAWAHRNDPPRRGGDPYIFHPMRVAHHVALCGASFHQVAAAWLHDTVEDTEVTLDMLTQYVPDGTIRLVDAMTRRSGETYPGFIARLLREPGAPPIKREDILDNLGPYTTKSQRAKYNAALAQLGYGDEATARQRPLGRQERPGIQRIVWGQG